MDFHFKFFSFKPPILSEVLTWLLIAGPEVEILFDNGEKH